MIDMKNRLGVLQHNKRHNTPTSAVSSGKASMSKASKTSSKVVPLIEASDESDESGGGTGKKVEGGGGSSGDGDGGEAEGELVEKEGEDEKAEAAMIAHTQAAAAASSGMQSFLPPLIGVIEVQWGGRVFRTCFPLPLASKFLTKKTKADFLKKVRGCVCGWSVG
jgi:hypothetical protein